MTKEPTDNTENEDNVDSSSANISSDEESDALLASDSESDAEKEIECQPCEVRTTTSRHDDWLHRGVQLAALPFIVYMARVKKVPRPTRSNTSRKYIFSFDPHYPSAVLYCQQIGDYMAIPRLVGAVCPPPELNDGEDIAAYKLMLFSTARCPGKGACSDALMFRPLLQKTTTTNDRYRFAPAWRILRSRLVVLEARAALKIEAAGKIAVLRDTATMKLYHESPASQPKARFYLLLTLQLVETFMQANAISLPDGHTEITSKIISFLSSATSNHPEQLHLEEFAAH